MRLKNKQTGHIIECSIICSDENLSPHLIKSNEGRPITLADLNEEWEDAPEESKFYYFISPLDEGVVRATKVEGDAVDEFNNEIGNYFETREQAEAAVEKLKALKRLKDKGFKIKGWGQNELFKGDIVINASINPLNWDAATAVNLDTLFGGEE